MSPLPCLLDAEDRARLESGREALRSETETHPTREGQPSCRSAHRNHPTHRKLPAAEGGAPSCFSKHFGEKIGLPAPEVTQRSQAAGAGGLKGCAASETRRGDGARSLQSVPGRGTCDLGAFGGAAWA